VTGAIPQFSQLLTLLPDFAASANVNENGDKNHDPVTRHRLALSRPMVIRRWQALLPDRAVERRNTEDIPRLGNPAPQSRIAIHLALLFSLDKDE